ncbi:glycine-rich cell wall structural protein 1-like [Penaeus monodon]|uniref:glycine-rich cell wall structural protein 1-like n=1 Tax=Penaeus monodon TaxID=6687 RepID=UPI0018A7D473|nr:glycine-rich cell wall structural protein 1-like [Penaeus monodon]
MSGGSGGRMASLGSAGRLVSPGSSGSQTPVSGGGVSRHSFAGGIGQRPVGGTNRHSFAGGMSGQRSAGSLGSLGKVAGGSRHSYAGGFGAGAGGVVVNPLGQTFTLPARPRGEIFPGGSLPRSLKDIKMSTIARADVHCPVDQLMKSTETVV